MLFKEMMMQKRREGKEGAFEEEEEMQKSKEKSCLLSVTPETQEIAVLRGSL